MHGEDESSFNAKILPTKTGVNMSVDFYGKGQYPPGAYHSEGHQDSMGLAIFFALIDSISTSPFGIIALDDVVMSIDLEHRRGICTIIDRYAENHQFITTHDLVWARILVSENVIEKGNSIHFQSWDIEAGPTITVDRGFCEETRGGPKLI